MLQYLVVSLLTPINLQVSEEHLPPQQLDLPEYVQDVPEALPETAEEVKKMATMAVRDYQRLSSKCVFQ